MKINLKLLCLFTIICFVNYSCATQKTKTKKEKRSTTKITKEKKNKKTTKNTTNQKLENIENLIKTNTLNIAELNTKIQYLEELMNSHSANDMLLDKPLSIYNKKLILNNGTTIYGNITYQDDHMLQVETVLGTLSLDKNSIIRVVDQDVQVVDADENMINLNIVQSNPTPTNTSNAFPNSAKVILLGEFMESHDENNNTILSGTLKNVGQKRADFTKITFTIYKDQKHSAATKEYTVFISGSSVEFEQNIISNSSLHPEENGIFSVMIPSAFGPFVSYSYRIDWEQYD